MKWIQIDRRTSATLLCLFGFALPLSLPVAEAFFFLALLVGAAASLRGQSSFCFKTAYLIPVLLFIIVALAGVIWSSRPQASAGKLHRLLFLLVIFQIPAVFNRADSLKIDCLTTSFILGVAIKGGYDLIRIPLYVLRGGALYDAGSMTDPQFYMAAICVIAAIHGKRALALCPPFDRFSFFLLALMSSISGLILHFKRGVWISTALSIGLLLCIKRRWRTIAALCVCALLLYLVPQVRQRVAQLPQEFSEQQGGRWVLWTKVGPELISENPWGIGWHATRNEDFLNYAEYVQPKLDHLHNNVLQITLELGFLGGAVWTGWMLWTLWFMWQAYRKCAVESSKYASLALGVTAAFVALLLNGMVENNFDDSEIMLLFCMLMGIANWISQRASSSTA